MGSPVSRKSERRDGDGVKRRDPGSEVEPAADLDDERVIARRIEDVTDLLTDIQSTLTLQATRTAFVLETVLDKPGLGPIDPALLAPEAPARAGDQAGPRAKARRPARRSS